MKLQRSTWVLLLTACLMASAIYLYEGVGSKQRETAETAVKRLFSIATEDQVTALTVRTTQYTLQLQRMANPSPSGISTTASIASPGFTPTPTSTPTVSPSPTQPPSPAWNVTVQAPAAQKASARLANEATVTFLVNLLVSSDRQPISPTDSSKNVLTVPASQKETFGLSNPFATIDIQLKDGKKHQLILGQPNFNRSALYAQVDPIGNSDQDLKVTLVPITFGNAVQRPIADWYPAPPSPSPPKSKLKDQK